MTTRVKKDRQVSRWDGGGVKMGGWKMGFEGVQPLRFYARPIRDRIPGQPKRQQRQTPDSRLTPPIETLDLD